MRNSEFKVEVMKLGIVGGEKKRVWDEGKRHAFWELMTEEKKEKRDAKEAKRTMRKARRLQRLRGW